MDVFQPNTYLKVFQIAKALNPLPLELAVTSARVVKMTLEEYLQLALLGLVLLFAFLTMEMRDLLKAVGCLFVMSVALGALFWMLGAPFVAVLQLLIYGGAVIALFIIVIMFTRRE